MAPLDTGEVTVLGMPLSLRRATLRDVPAKTPLGVIHPRCTVGACFRRDCLEAAPDTFPTVVCARAPLELTGKAVAVVT